MKSLLTLLKLLPEILTLVKEFLEMAKQGVHIIEVKRRMGEVTKAVKRSTDEKDTGDLERLFNPNGNPDLH